MDIVIFNLVSLNIVLSVLVRTLIIFFFAFLILRLMGKRQLTHLTYIDLLLIIALGSSVGDVMIYDESVVQMFSSIIAISVVGVFVKVLNELSSHSKRINDLVTGHASLIIENGQFLHKALAHEDISEEDVLGMLRQKGFLSVKEIKKAFLEADGELSVITKNMRMHKN
ncbi:hypothetical protein A2442_00180 [Candidatus Campbellbacteria bacterium RIFOXYC2_FULL_35_25]|uniref:DUF421 domain-containing protein n=1 Tax=Candidatus Campbellbacteria bacterium RIFOXYC2_FULL_35_25 TaxID=1797582 RepID=A0A1F5EGY7_9BACT|nr:MAG: hypothetical protein A2442_00180 [Candidatus Campbellbacteria bacterium RIFOXYC2_FULL_35_25]